MVGTEGFTVVDGTVDIEEQQKRVRQKVMEVLPQAMRKKISAGSLDQ